MLCLPYPVLSPVVFSFKYQQRSVGILTKSWTSTPGNHICWRQGCNDHFHSFHIFTTISMRIISLIFTHIHLLHKGGLLPSASQTKILIALKIFISVNSSCNTPNPIPPPQNAASFYIFRKCNPWGWWETIKYKVQQNAIWPVYYINETTEEIYKIHKKTNPTHLKGKSKDVPVCNMTAYGEQVYVFLTSAFDGDAQSVSCPKHFTPATLQRGCWLGPRAGMDVLEKGKTYSFSLKSYVMIPHLSSWHSSHSTNWTIPVFPLC